MDASPLAWRAPRSLWDEVANAPYTVELLGWPDLSPSQRAELEVKFADAIAQRFGNVDGVVRAFFESYAQEEADALATPDIPPAETTWWSAEKQAASAALQGRQAPAGARFWLSLYDQVYDRPAR
jgi:hypothetical protein